VKGRARVLVVLALAVVLLTAFPSATGLAEGNKTEFTGTET
jgi:hypothetical protein